MPKSKRNKVVSLTATRKKGVELKRKVMDEVKACVDEYARIFLFSVKNMRNSKLKDVREEWRHSRFFFGKNKVIVAAFGRSPQDEYKDNLHLISEHIRGQKGLLFTNCTKDEVLKFFTSLSSPDFARTDDVATRNVTLEEGPLEQFESSLEPYLRQLGLTTTLKKGVIHLMKEYNVCKVGEKLTSEKARLLKLLGIEMAEFGFEIEMMWNNDGTVEYFGDEKNRSKKVKKSSISAKKAKLEKKKEDESEEEDESEIDVDDLGDYNEESDEEEDE